MARVPARRFVGDGRSPALKGSVCWTWALTWSVFGGHQAPFGAQLLKPVEYLVVKTFVAVLPDR